MTKTQLLDQLHVFINQRPGLNWQDYNDAQLYRRETREIYRDLVLAREMLGLIASNPEITADMLSEYLDGRNRLRLEGGVVDFIAGQYFATEYRPAVSRLCVNLLWRVASRYETSERKTREILRQSLKGRVSRRASKLMDL